MLNIALLAVFAASAAAGTSGGLTGKPAPSSDVHESPDRRFRWSAGSSWVSVFRPGQRRPTRRVRLPPLKEGATRRKVLFGEKGDFFCVVDENVRDFGLHLDVDRGAKAAKATIINSWVRLVDAWGRVRWAKRMREKHVVGDPGTSPLRIAGDGTSAILLQDADPYARARPLLLVYSPRGKKLLTIDYVDFKHIDEFALSEDGGSVAVRGYGRVTKRETWEKALALYDVKSKKKWVHPVPRAGRGRALRVVEPSGVVCCVRENDGYAVYGPKGRTRTIDAVEAAARYGLAP